MVATKPLVALALATLLAAPAFVRAADKPASTGTTIILPPIDPRAGVTVPQEMIDALRKMSDDDFKTRQEAVTKLQQLMSHQFQQMVALQTLMLRVQDGLAAQLREMTQGAAGQEPDVRVAGLMEFNSALSRWAIDVMALPENERNDMLAWGMKDENVPLVARVYSRSDEVRAKVSRDLARMEGSQAEWMLVQLLNDPSREVSLTTIDAIYDRKPTPRVVAALWDRATAAAMNQVHQRQQRQKIINVRGRMVSVFEQDLAAQSRMQDPDIAADLLLKYNDPQITDKLNAMFKEFAGSVGNQNDYRWRILSPNYGDSGRALSRLVEQYKPKEVVGFLFKVLAVDANDGSETTVNNDKMRYSSRIDSAAMIIKVTGQDPDDYKIKKYSNWGDRWLIKGGLPEEEAMVKKLQAWWKENSAKYQPSDAPSSPPPSASRP